MLDLTVSEIKRKLQLADAQSFAVLERSLVADTRKGVRKAVEVARRRIAAEEAEQARLESMYAFERELADSHGTSVIVGLDEVGRGSLAGPLVVGAVVLSAEDRISGLNDSKQIKSSMRETIASEIRSRALAWTVQHIEPGVIDATGMTASLKAAFCKAVCAIEQCGIIPDIILLDGNPLHFDERELNVVKGDAQCASIAAASIIAKVERDAIMEKFDAEYPEYGFALNKGYASADHIEALKRYGLSPIHRKSFCTNFMQQTLF